MFLYVRLLIYVISNKVSGHVYAGFQFVCSIREGGTRTQVQNLSWTIVLFMTQVPHKSSELDMQTSPPPHMHALCLHEALPICPDSPRGVFDENPFCGSAWSRAVTDI